MNQNASIPPKGEIQYTHGVHANDGVVADQMVLDCVHVVHGKCVFAVRENDVANVAQAQTDLSADDGVLPYSAEWQAKLLNDFVAQHAMCCPGIEQTLEDAARGITDATPPPCIVAYRAINNWLIVTRPLERHLHTSPSESPVNSARALSSCLGELGIIQEAFTGSLGCPQFTSTKQGEAK